jgi:hypothetical protein
LFILAELKTLTLVEKNVVYVNTNENSFRNELINIKVYHALSHYRVEITILLKNLDKGVWGLNFSYSKITGNGPDYDALYVFY